MRAVAAERDARSADAQAHALPFGRVQDVPEPAQLGLGVRGHRVVGKERVSVPLLLETDLARALELVVDAPRAGVVAELVVGVAEPGLLPGDGLERVAGGTRECYAARVADEDLDTLRGVAGAAARAPVVVLAEGAAVAEGFNPP